MTIQDRRERERQLRRSQILSSATEIFSTEGQSGASMSAIAKRAELGKATLYYYFKTKEDLYEAVVNEGVREFFSSLADLTPAEDLAEAVEQLVLAYQDFFEPRPALHQILAPLLTSMYVSSQEHTHSSHLAFLADLTLHIAKSSWASSYDPFFSFVVDLLLSTSQRMLSGQPQTRERLDFYLDLIRSKS